MYQVKLLKQYLFHLDCIKAMKTSMITVLLQLSGEFKSYYTSLSSVIDTVVHAFVRHLVRCENVRKSGSIWLSQSEGDQEAVHAHVCMCSTYTLHITCSIAYVWLWNISWIINVTKSTPGMDTLTEQLFCKRVFPINFCFGYHISSKYGTLSNYGTLSF